MDGQQSMAKRQLLHTPEGVRDIYNDECKKKQILQEQLKRTMECYGYRIIQTPTFEFFDIFGKEIGTTPSKDLYKFFDREGNTLVLRPDITPSIARAVAMYLEEEEKPIRLYYMGNTFINNSSYQGRLKESTQIGAEFVGGNSAAVDAELISMAVECFLAAGLKEFRINIGHADFFAGLMEAAGFEAQAAEGLKELIANKNYFGVEEVVSSHSMAEELKELFAMLGGFYFSEDELAKAERLAAGYPKILAAVTRLKELHQVLKVYGIDRYISFELGIVSSYQYYTGIIFAGYTFGSGEAILKGGRYDKLHSYFGRDAASIGFAIVVDQLMAALGRQGIAIGVPCEGELIVYRQERLNEAIARAGKLRRAGIAAELICMDGAFDKAACGAYAKKNHREKITYLE